MNNLFLLTLVFAGLILTACGGGGSTGGSAPKSSSSSAVVSSSSSSIASSSSSSVDPGPVASCSFAEGEVFIDSTCDGVQAPTTYEINKTSGQGSEEQAIGAETNMIAQQILTTAEVGHYNVLDVVYNSSTEYNGGVHFLTPDIAPVDLSVFASGTLQFDLKVLNLGDDQMPLIFKAVCGWPCESTEYVVSPVELNKWQKVSLPVSTLVSRGLDLTKVTVAIEILPSWEHQSGAHFQVDNIRWVTGSLPLASSKCYAQHLNGDIPISIYLSETFAADYAQWLSVFAQVSIHPQWDQIGSRFGFNFVDNDGFNNCLGAGKLSMDVYIPKSYITDGNLSVGLEAGEIGGAVSYLSEVPAMNLKGNDWNHLEVDLTGRNLPNTTNMLGVFFQPNGKPMEVTGDFVVDNLVITNN